MIILDTCAIIFDALAPKKLSRNAKKAIEQGEKTQQLFCCDISLWEVAMLIEKKRLDPKIDTETFLQNTLQARSIQILAINPNIATLSTTSSFFYHFDPADRIIAATAMHHGASLITSDQKLSRIPGLFVIC